MDSSKIEKGFVKHFFFLEKKTCAKRKTFFFGKAFFFKERFMIKEDLVLTIPNPHRKEISVDLLSRILKQAKITREGWLEK